MPFWRKVSNFFTDGIVGPPSPMQAPPPLPIPMHKLPYSPKVEFRVGPKLQYVWTVRKNFVDEYGPYFSEKIQKSLMISPNPIVARLYVNLPEDDPGAFSVFYEFAKHGKIDINRPDRKDSLNPNKQVHPVRPFIRVWVFLDKLAPDKVELLKRRAFQAAYDHYVTNSFILMPADVKYVCEWLRSDSLLYEFLAILSVQSKAITDMQSPAKRDEWRTLKEKWSEFEERRNLCFRHRDYHNQETREKWLTDFKKFFEPVSTQRRAGEMEYVGTLPQSQSSNVVAGPSTSTAVLLDVGPFNELNPFRDNAAIDEDRLSMEVQGGSEMWHTGQTPQEPSSLI